jgi:hypothetical protein
MLSIEAFRKIDPSITEKLTEEELRELYDSFYSLGQLMFEVWRLGKQSSKNQLGLLTESKDKDKI